MWRLVKEGLRIYRPVVLNAWTIGTLAAVVAPAVLALCGVLSPRAAFSWRASAWPLYILVASAIAGWIILGTEMTEHRLRLHLLLPLPLRQIGLAQLLLPAAVMLLGLLVAHAVSVVGVAASGSTIRWERHAGIDLNAAHFLLFIQLTFAVKEIVSALESRLGKALAASLVPTLVLSAQLWIGLSLGSALLELALVLALTGLLMAVTIGLFCRRSQFAR